MTIMGKKSTNHILAVLSIAIAALFMPFNSSSQDMYGITVYREFPGQRAQVFSKTFQNISQLKLELDAVKRKYAGDSSHNYSITTVSDGKRQSPHFINNITWVMKHDGAVKYLKSQPAIPSESTTPTVYTAYQCTNNGKEMPKTAKHRDLTYSYFERVSGMDQKIGNALFYDFDTAKSKAKQHFEQSVTEYGDSIFYEVVVFKGSSDDPKHTYSNLQQFNEFQEQEQEKQRLIQLQAKIDSISNTFPERLKRIAPPTENNLPIALDACIDVVNQDTLQLSDPGNLILLEHTLRSFIEASIADEETLGKIYDDVNFAYLFLTLNHKTNIADRYACFLNIISKIKDSCEKRVKPVKKDTPKNSKKDKDKKVKKDKNGK